MRAAGQSLAVFALLVALTVLLTWPLAGRLDSAVTDLGDPVLTTWILAWDVHALEGAPLRLFDANMFHPHRWTLAYTEHLLGLIPLVLPARRAGAGPLVAHNLVLLGTFPLAGLAMFWLVRHLTALSGAAAVAAVLYAFAPYRFGQLGHIQLLSHQWLPLLLLGLHRAATSGARWRDLALAGLAFTLQALSSAYHAVLAAVTVVVFLGWLVAPAGRPPLGRLLARGLVAGALVLCVLVPLFVPYAIVRDEARLVRDLHEVRLYSATPASYLAAPSMSRWLGGPTARFRSPEAALFPGGVALLLAVVGAVAGRARRPGAGRAEAPGPATTARPTDPGATRPARRSARQAGGRPLARMLDTALAALLGVTAVNVLLVGGFVLRLGPARVSQRNLAWALGLVPLALAVRRLARRRPAPLPGLGGLRCLAWPEPAGCYVALAAVGALLSFGPVLELGPLTLHPVYAQLYRQVPGFDGFRVPARFGLLVVTAVAVLAGFGAAAVLRRVARPILSGLVFLVLAGLGLFEAWAVPIPFVTAPREPPADRWLADAPQPGAVAVLPLHVGASWHRESLRLFGAMAHWRPLVNGYAGTVPPEYWETVATLNTFPSPAAVDRLRQLYVRFVVLELRHYGKEDRARLLAAVAAPPPGVTPVATLGDTVILEVGSPAEAAGGAVAPPITGRP